MKIAVVILNWNGETLLARFLPKVLEHSQGASIHVVDNASTDGSIDLIKKDFPTVGLVQNKSNGGFAQGYNDGLKHIDADIYCLLNSDVEVTPNWLEPIKELFQEKPEQWMLQVFLGTDKRTVPRKT